MKEQITRDPNLFQFCEASNNQSETISAPKYSYWQSVSRTFFANKVAMLMLILLTVIILMSFIQPLFSNYDLMNVDNINDFSKRYNPPSLTHWFGTDADGQSLFDAVWAGARTSILISILATIITNVVGITVGAFWGISKRIDPIMLEIYNVVSNVPSLLIIIVLSYTFGSGFFNLLFAMCVTSWLGGAYFIRVQVMVIRDREYNLASKTLGTSQPQIIFKNILPYLTSVIVTIISRDLPAFISVETFLSYLGVGLSADVPSLGTLIKQYSTNIASQPYLFWIPVAVLALISISLYLVGQALADATDPKRHI